MRVWFNHWFSTAYHLISLMREGFGETVVFVGSNSNPSAVYRKVCDEWYPEEELSSDRYVDFCLDFCTKHAIDVFVPRRGLTAIANASQCFAAQGVKLLSERRGTLVELLENKAETYHFFISDIPEIIPKYRLVHSLDEFNIACDLLESLSGRLCYKLCIDEGARSFRVLDDSIETIGALYAKPGTKITRRAAESILSGYDFSIPLIVMPWLSGADISVDCLSTNTGPIVLPRIKVGRYTMVQPNEKVMELCNDIMNMLHPEMPVNVQFKLEGDIPYLLEVNPRMSGGLQLGCKATGINLPALALRKLLGKSVNWHYPDPWLPTSVVNLESPIII